MQHSVVVIGQGEMGGVFSRACLRAEFPVIPVTRRGNLRDVQEYLPNPAMVVIAVGEKDLAEIIPALSPPWRECSVLIQNELLPQDWAGYGASYQPTVISVWFEKKPGQDVKVIIPSPIYGPRATLLASVLTALRIPSTVLANAEQLLYQLVLKNVYILTSNIAGLKYGGNVGDLWQRHREFTRYLSGDIIEIQSAICQTNFSSDRLLEDLLMAFAGDPQHRCMGRSAAARLQSAMAHANRLALAVPTLREIAAECGNQ